MDKYIMNCYLCGSDDIKFITDAGDKFTIEKEWLCFNCGLGFLNPRIENIDEYYLSNNYSLDFRGSASPGASKHLKNVENAGLRWHGIRDYVPQSGKLLEIGCSSGEFLDLAKSRFDVYGIDMSTGFVESVSDDVNAVVGKFPEESFEASVDKFDIICTFQVLEHVEDPKSFLSACRNRLSDDGFFVLEYPDLDIASRRTVFTSEYFQRSHLYDFSFANIIALLSETGFAVVHIGRYDGHPKDKNVLLICRKSNSNIAYDTIDKDFIRCLYDRILAKLKTINISRNAPLRVCHIASHNINVGDGAIIYGIRDTVSAAVYPHHVGISDVDIVDYSSFGQELSADSINSHNFDLILVGGGGTIDGHGHRRFSGTAFPMSVAELSKLSSPIAFVALGHNLFPNQKFEQLDVLVSFLRYCKASDIPFSVRRDRSHERLAAVLPPDVSAYIERVADPGFFISTDTAINPPCYSDVHGKNIIIQIAPDAYEHRFGQENTQDTLDKFLLSMGKYVEYAAQRYNANVIFAAHTTDDVWGIAAMYHRINSRTARMNTRFTGVVHPSRAREFFELYRRADLVIGMRGHSVICATGLGTPTIAISTHDKVGGFMDELALNDWVITPRDVDFAEKLTAMSDVLLDNRTIQVASSAIASNNWQAEFRAFINKSLEKII